MSSHLLDESSVHRHLFFGEAEECDEDERVRGDAPLESLRPGDG